MSIDSDFSMGLFKSTILGIINLTKDLSNKFNQESKSTVRLQYIKYQNEKMLMK
jgi:hypothetical protein